MMILALLGALAAGDAGHAYEDGTEAMFVAPDFRSPAMYAWRCEAPRTFEQVASSGRGRLVDLEWRPHTSELSFDMGAANAGITLTERFVTETSLASSPGCK